MSRSRYLEVLAQAELFSGVEPAILEQLLAQGRSARLGRGEALFEAGSFGDEIFLVLDGQLELERFNAEGRAEPCGRIGPGQSLGESALLGRGRQPVSARARGAATVLAVRRGAFEQLFRKDKGVRARVEALYERRAKELMLSASRHFRELPAELRAEAARAARLGVYSRGDVIAAAGAPAHAVLLIRSGHVRVSRPGDAKEQILAYLGPDDSFGDEEVVSGGAYQASATALEPVEALHLPRSTAWRLFSTQPTLFSALRRYTAGRERGRADLLGSSTNLGFVRGLLESGLARGRSALVLDLGSCLRCGNCVLACDALHGHSRMTRRGRTLTRRVEPAAGRYQHLFFPSSCVQCASPECMVGCPTGAIARDAQGEVFIRQGCIGCGTCARNCELGNISIVELARGDADEGGPRAVKCDACREQEIAACVYNCPTGALLRLDPSTAFPELAPLQGREAAPAPASPRRIRGDLLAQAATALLAAAVSALTWPMVQHAPGQGTRGLAGWGAALGFVALGALAGRKRLRAHRAGGLGGWIRAHGVLSWLVLALALFHAAGRAEGVLAAALLALLALALGTGLGGQLAGLLLPPILARSDDDVLLPEDRRARRQSLAASSAEYLAGLRPEARRRVEAQVERLLEGGLRYLVRGTRAEPLGGQLLRRSKRLPALDEAEHALALRLAEARALARLDRARAALELLLAGWPVLHAAAAAGALALVLAHVAATFSW